MRMRCRNNPLLTRLAFVLAVCLFALPGRVVSGELGGLGGLLGEGIDFKGGMLDWEEDDDGRKVAILRNYAVVTLNELTVSARNMVLNVELQELYAEGDVVFEEKSGNSFQCDQLTFNYQEWRGLAKNIRVKVGGDKPLPVRDFLDTRPSIATESQAGLSGLEEGGPLRRMHVHAQELRAHDRQTFELIDAKITPDAFAKPHWYFRSPAALLRRDEKIESYHNTVNIGRVPVLYFPYLIRDLQYDWPWMRMSAGYTGDYGFFVRTQWGWRLKERPNAYLRADKIYFDLDWYSRRGVGVGVETTYKMGHLESLGKLKLYGVYEYAISKDRDMERALNDNDTRIYSGDPRFTPDLYGDKFRWAVDWEHYQQLNELWDVRAEVHLYHDRDYLRDYDPARYWNAKAPENSIDLRRLDRNWELEFVAQSRLSNKWMTQSEYLPEARLTVPSLRLGDLPLYLKDDMRLGVVNRRFDEDKYKYDQYKPSGYFGIDPETGLSNSRLWDRDNYGEFFRAFNEFRLEAPMHLYGAMTLTPWVGLRTAYYQDTLGSPLPDGSLTPDDLYWRQRGVFTPGQMTSKGKGEAYYAVPFGANLTTRTYTIFGSHDQWRLITEPEFSYLENSKPNLDSEYDLYQIDFYDEYYRQRRLGFELHNKLQRRDYELAEGTTIPYRNILDFNFKAYYYPREKDQDRLNYGRELSEFEFDVIYRPIRNLALAANLRYDTEDNTVNRGIFWIDWRLANRFRIYAAHYHYRGNYWRYPNSPPSDQTYFAVRTKLWNDSSHYAIEGAVNYEWRNSAANSPSTRHGFNEYRVTLYRDMDTFELALSYVRNRNKDDEGVYFQLSPKNFMTRESPPPLYSTDVEALAAGRYSDPESFAKSDSFIDTPIVDADLKDVQF